MKDGIIVYTNPVSKWFWESGIAPWVFGVLALVFLILIIEAWREGRK
jgi:hypothetical protein